MQLCYFIWWFKASPLLLSCLFRSTDPERKLDCRSGSRSSWGQRLSLVLTHTEPRARLLTLLNSCSLSVELPLGEMCWLKAHASPIQRNSRLRRYLSECVYSNCDVPVFPHTGKSWVLQCWFSVMENFIHVMENNSDMTVLLTRLF